MFLSYICLLGFETPQEIIDMEINSVFIVCMEKQQEIIDIKLCIFGVLTWRSDQQRVFCYKIRKNGHFFFNHLHTKKVC